MTQRSTEANGYHDDAVDTTSDIDAIYTPIAQACVELHRRRSDALLEKRVEEYLRNDIPDVLRREPAAISTAHVASPNFAAMAIHSAARSSNLPLVMLEYLDDLFVTTNYDKASLAKMRFLLSASERGQQWTSRKIIDLSGPAEKKPIKSIATIWDESLVEFHHRLLKQTTSEPILWDASQWYDRCGNTPCAQYLSTMALYIRHGILFENFLTTRSERCFTETVIMPAFREVNRHFGLKPLIVRIFPKCGESDRKWWAYPKETLDLMPDSRQPLLSCKAIRTKIAEQTPAPYSSPAAGSESGEP